ncbi:MAG TPA: hypothetical protein VGD34_06025 [Kribbella sp.]
MEYTSYLAGEPWSDHPDCTHPLLALVAREVNDETSDPARTALAPLIPDVIGLKPDDPRLAPALVARCVGLVLPVVSEQFKRVLTVALLAAEQLLADLERGPRTRCSDYANRTAPRALAGAIRAVTDFRAPNADQLLRQLLVESIDECHHWTAHPDSPVAVPSERTTTAAPTP